MSAAMKLIQELENDFNQLKKEYTLFLNDVVNIEPYELKEKVDKSLKRLRNLSNLRTEEQFRTNNLTSKVNSHMQLWQRQLDAKYSGKGARRPPPRKAPPPPQPQKPQTKSVVIGDVASQRDKVVELYDEYMRLNLASGKGKGINFSKFQSFIHNQTKKVQAARGVDQVRYEIAVQDDKVVIKSKSVKKNS